MSAQDPSVAFLDALERLTECAPADVILEALGERLAEQMCPQIAVAMRGVLADVACWHEAQQCSLEAACFRWESVDRQSGEGGT
jgi:hypothetical protein